MEKDCRYCKHFPLTADHWIKVGKELIEDQDKRERTWESAPCGVEQGPCVERRFEPAA